MSAPDRLSTLDRTRAAWAGSPPVWVEVLARACDSTSQNAVAKRLSRSAALVSNVLANKYPGDMSATELVVQGVLMSATVDCPVLGEVPTNICIDNQDQPLCTASPQGWKLYRACQTCDRRLDGGKDV